jgi:hypothetical protein
MFSAYMQEVNFKNFIIFSLFYLLFCFGPQVCIGNSSFGICGVVPWLGSVRSIILLHTRAHVHTILLHHFTGKFSHTTRHSHMTLSQTEKDQRLLSDVPVY